MRTRLLVATTVPDTLAVILKDQPRFLNQHFDVHIVTSPGPQWGLIQKEGVPIHEVAMQRGISPLSDLVSLWRMVRLILKIRPTIIHSYTPKAGLVSMLAAWMCRVPVRVHTFTGLIWPTTHGFKRLILVVVDRLLCACATQVVPEGAGVLHDIKVGRITGKPLSIIGHGNIAGVDVDYFSTRAPSVKDAALQLRAIHGIHENSFVFVFVGRLNRDKGLDELLSAFQKLPANCRLLVAGNEDLSAPISKSATQTLMTHPRIHWLGFLEDIRPCLLVANVLVLPSYREGFPNVVLQAGAMERPVIATDISGCNEAITPGLNGWLVPVKDANTLEFAMREAVKSPELVLASMGNSARERIVARFERTAHWDRMLDFYRSQLRSLPVEAPETLLLIASFAESILNFRKDLLISIQTKGLEVHIAAPGILVNRQLRDKMTEYGWTLHPIQLQRSNLNPLLNLRSAWSVLSLVRKVRPDYVLAYTIKPVIYGMFASWLVRIPKRYALLTGLGYVFVHLSDRKVLSFFIRKAYSFVMGKTNKVFFQNPDDQALFRSLGLLPPSTPSCVVNGSGVDVADFAVAPVPPEPHFLLIARLLGDKGVREYAQAAQRTRALYPQARFSLVGWLDENPDAIAQSELDSWVQAGTLDFLGRLSDVRPAIAACSVYVLPSYREGTPRTVLEAMAMGRAVITTDAPGCRETVVDGDNGFLVPVQSVDALAEAMARFITDPTLATRMGQRGRQLAEDKYDVHKVNAVMLKEMGLA